MQLAAGVSGQPFHIHRLPAPVLMCAGAVGSAASMAGIPVEMNLVNARLLCVGNYYDSSKAISELSMPQSTVKQAIQDALEWYHEQGMIKI
jgi:dihydroflavonol-4-reductase